MSVRSFHSVFMASAVAGAALGCYLVSLRVASERAALEQVETNIVLAQRDIRLLQTEIGTRARLSQLERWNVRVLALSAPTADQILGDKFQLARLIAPERKPAVEAPVILATAPVTQPEQPLAEEHGSPSAPTGQLLHEASVKIATKNPTTPRQKPVIAQPKPAQPAATPPRPMQTAVATPKAGGEKRVAEQTVTKAATVTKPAITAGTEPVRTARADPLAPLTADQSTAKGPRTER